MCWLFARIRLKSEDLDLAPRGTALYDGAVQLDLLTGPRAHTTLPSIRVAGKVVPLHLVVNSRARRYVLRLRPDGTARVTVPQRGSFRAARDFALRNTEWLEQQLQRLAERPARDTTWRMGQEILFRGAMVAIAAGEAPSSVTVADQCIPISEESLDLRPAIERGLRQIATTELPLRVFHIAQLHGLAVRRVMVRDQKSRWGSCSPRGTISLNWRLIQTPQFVSDYIVLHELMHLREMNHSARFWREVQSVCPNFREAERWLKAHSGTLRS